MIQTMEAEEILDQDDRIPLYLLSVEMGNANQGEKITYDVLEIVRNRHSLIVEMEIVSLVLKTTLRVLPTARKKLYVEMAFVSKGKTTEIANEIARRVVFLDVKPDAEMADA
jgi:hypothetical protein